MAETKEYTMTTQMVDRFLLSIYLLATYQPFASSLYNEKDVDDMRELVLTSIMLREGLKKKFKKLRKIP